MVPNFNGPLFLILLIGHLFGDYYFQTQKISQKKKENYVFLLLHSLIYSISISMACTFMQLKWVSFIIAALSHWIIDTLKWDIARKRKNAKNPYFLLYLIDQVLHLFFIILITCKNPETKMIASIPIEVLAWLALILLLLKPANVTLYTLFKSPIITAKTGSYKNKRWADEKLPINSGIRIPSTVVGNLERLFIIILVYFSQFIGLGFLIAAKSIALSEKGSNNPMFAKYHLIGTLYNLIYTILAYILIFLVILK